MTTATGSRSVDLVVFSALVTSLFGTSEGLRVYHEATPTRISIVAAAPGSDPV